MNDFFSPVDDRMRWLLVDMASERGVAVLLSVMPPVFGAGVSLFDVSGICLVTIFAMWPIGCSLTQLDQLMTE